MITLETPRLFIRPWTLQQSDREVFHSIMSDPAIRKFYVTRLSRHESDTLLEEVVRSFPDDALAWQAACLKSSGAPIGYTGLSRVAYELPITPCVEIGWQFLPVYWNKGYATEAARALLAHGFQHHKLNEIVAFAVHNNHASIAVMEKIGMQRDCDAGFDHPVVPAGFEHLNPQVVYRARPETQSS